MSYAAIEMLEAEWRDRLKAAVLAEREACAKIVESHGPTLANGLMLTEAIRARDYKQDGQCKRCTEGCPACDARRQSNVLP